MSLRIFMLLFLCCSEFDAINPITMQLPNGFNISAYIGSYTLCDAVKLCHDEGKKILSYNALREIQRSSEFRNKNVSGILLTSQLWWVGLVDALVERNYSKTGWIWIESGYATTASEGDNVFYLTEPNDFGVGEDCVSAIGSDMKALDFPCNVRINALCFTSNEKNESQIAQRFSNFVETPIIDYTQSAAGCSISVSKKSKLTCAAECLKIAHSDCVGFYWNSVRLECILLPFFDAAVQLNSNSVKEKLQWVKYLRVNTF